MNLIYSIIQDLILTLHLNAQKEDLADIASCMASKILKRKKQLQMNATA